MWDAPLYAVNTFYDHWLINKLLWPMARQNITRQESQTEYRKKEGGVEGDTSIHQRSKMQGNKPQALW